MCRSYQDHFLQWEGHIFLRTNNEQQISENIVFYEPILDFVLFFLFLLQLLILKKFSKTNIISNKIEIFIKNRLLNVKCHFFWKSVFLLLESDFRMCYIIFNIIFRGYCTKKNVCSPFDLYQLLECKQNNTEYCAYGIYLSNVLFQFLYSV